LSSLVAEEADAELFSTKEELSWRILLFTIPDEDNLLSNLILKQFKVLDKIISLLKSQFINNKGR
jgi:hypothetical protein